MARSVLTRDGDVVDALALAAYGRTAGATEALLDANPQLAGLGPVLVAGLQLALPDLPAPAPAPRVKLWS